MAVTGVGAGVLGRETGRPERRYGRATGEGWDGMGWGGEAESKDAGGRVRAERKVLVDGW